MTAMRSTRLVTQSASVLVLVSLLLSGLTGVALAGPSPGPSVMPAAAVKDAPGVVLRIETVPGFAPIEAHLLTVPRFTLYSDGLAVWTPQPDPITGEDAALLQARLDADQAQGLIDAAIALGRLGEAQSRYDLANLADADTTVFTIHAGALDKRISAYALGFEDDSPDREARSALVDLATWLAEPDAWLPDGVEVEAYQPPAYVGLFADEDPERSDLIAWPWDDLATDDLELLVEAPFFSLALLVPEQLELVRPVPSGVVFDIGIAAPDGKRAYRLLVRPVLPDESAATVTESIS